MGGEGRIDTVRKMGEERECGNGWTGKGMGPRIYRGKENN